MKNNETNNGRYIRSSSHIAILTYKTQNNCRSISSALRTLLSKHHNKSFPNKKGETMQEEMVSIRIQPGDLNMLKRFCLKHRYSYSDAIDSLIEMESK